MGKGRIITDHGAGRYTIELVEDRARAQAARALAVERVAALDSRISELEVDLAEAQAEVDSAADDLDQAIAAYQAEVQADGESDVDTTTPAVALQEAAAKRDAVAGDIRALKVQRLAAQRRIDLIDALPSLRQLEAWCADYTEDLSGEVATAEVPGEAQAVLVRPGYNGEAVYDQARDGALQPALSGTPAGVFYNLAMMPGWQKWRPTYRVATLDSLDTGAGTCAITLDAAASSQQGLGVNAQASYTGVPVQYMTCNASAFEVGDRVLVAFDGDTETPRVIGFESNPRLCEVTGFLSVEDSLIQWYGEPLVTALDTTQDQDQVQQRRAFGSDYYCDVSDTTFTETSPDISTVVIGTSTVNLLVDSLNQALPADVSAVDAQLADDIALGDDFECDGLSLDSAYQHSGSKSINAGGSAGSQDDGSGGLTWDSGCADGYTYDRVYSADTTYAHQASGQVSGNSLSAGWSRDTDKRMWFDWSDNVHSYVVDKFDIPGSVNPARNFSAVDTVTLGGVSVDITAVNAHFGNPALAMSRMDVVSWLPEVFVTRRPVGDYCAMVVCSLSGTTIEHYIIAFEKVDGSWQRCDVPSFMESEIPSLSQREAVFEQVTGDAYSESYTSVPGSVG